MQTLRMISSFLSGGPALEPLRNPLQQIFLGLLWSSLITVLATQLDHWLGLEGALILYLLGTALAGYSVGVYASLSSSMGAVGGLNYFFIPPQHTLLVDSPQSWIALIGLLLVSLIVSALTLRLQVERTNAEVERQQSTLARELLELLIGMDSRDEVITAGVSRISAILGANVSVISVRPAEALPDGIAPEIFHWCVRHGRMAGPYTDQGSSLEYWCVPIENEPTVSSVLKIPVVQGDLSHPKGKVPKRPNLLRMLGQQMSLALQREHAAVGQQKALIEKAKEEQRSIMLASIAHDLRTPLATILTGITGLKNTNSPMDSSEVAAILSSVEAETRRAATMADDVLTWVRLNVLGHTSLNAQWQSLSEIIEETVRRTQKLRESNGGLLTVHLEEDLPFIWGDAELLSKLIENLIENTLRHSGQTGTLTEIRVARSQQGIVCLIMDDGIGFPASINRSLQDSSLPKDQSGSKRGPGLGLSIVRSIVDLHKGAVELGARPDGLTGACVSVWLPIGK